LDTAIHGAIVLVCLVAVFQLYLSKTEAKALQREFVGIVDQVSDTIAARINRVASPCQVAGADKMLDVVKAMQSDDTMYRNRSKLSFTYGIGGAVLATLLTTLAVLALRSSKPAQDETSSCHQKHVSFKHIAADNLLTVIVVGAFEGYFIAKIASKYVPVSEKTVRRAILSRFRETLPMLKQCRSAYRPPPLATAMDTPRGLVCRSSSAIALATASMLVLGRLKASDRRETSSSRTFANLTLPLVGGCGMFFAITYIFFNNATGIEKKMNSKQAQRVVDQLVFSINAAIASFSPDQKDIVARQILQVLEENMEVESEDESLKHEIASNNSELVQKTRNLLLKVGEVGALIFCVGMLLQCPGSKHKLRDMGKYGLSTIATFVLGLSVAFVCEYLFLNLVIARYDGVFPNEVVEAAVTRLQAGLDSSSCEMPLLQNAPPLSESKRN
jgi:hypothetical protein